MGAYIIEEIRASDARTREKMRALLEREGIHLDPYLDYSVGAFDARNELVAVGSTYRATIRCVAVDAAHRGEGLLAQLLTALIGRQVQAGHAVSFLYTKPEGAPLFGDLGFHEIERVPDRLVFMTTHAHAFEAYIASLGPRQGGSNAAVVLNANPFTSGHLHLLEAASRENDVVHAFVVSEDVSLVPADVRMRLVREGAAHLSNVRCHPTGDYMVSTATFPSYFLRGEADVVRTQAQLDVRVFARIAHALGITRRYAGQEPFSTTTSLYNDVMREQLPKLNISFIERPRAQVMQVVISASHVRQLIHDGPVEAIRPFVPPATYAYFTSPLARPVIDAIRKAHNVRHE